MLPYISDKPQSTFAIAAFPGAPIVIRLSQHMSSRSDCFINIFFKYRRNRSVLFQWKYHLVQYSSQYNVSTSFPTIPCASTEWYSVIYQDNLARICRIGKSMSLHCSSMRVFIKLHRALSIPANNARHPLAVSIASNTHSLSSCMSLLYASGIPFISSKE